MTKITGKTSDCARFRAASPLFAKAMDFLCRPDVATLAPGRHEIDGDRCWANVQDATLVPPGERKLEAHRKYVDVQAPLTGPETIGVAAMDAAALALPFDEKNDCVVYDGPSEPIALAPGEFAVFPPLVAHAPCCIAPGGPAKIKKVVVKILAAESGVESL